MFQKNHLIMTRIFSDERYQEITNWALNPYPNGLTTAIIPMNQQSVEQIRRAANIEEKQWGNTMIGQENNNNWTTKLGEGLVHDTLVLRGENPRRPLRIDGYNPDWETDEYIYEVKTRNWTTTGTAGEKVYGTMYKYSDIPEIYGKPLRIVCVAYQEWELGNSNTRIFGVISPQKQRFIDLAAEMGITYMKFSDLV